MKLTIKGQRQTATTQTATTQLVVDRRQFAAAFARVRLALAGLGMVVLMASTGHVRAEDLSGPAHSYVAEAAAEPERWPVEPVVVALGDPLASVSTSTQTTGPTTAVVPSLLPSAERYNAMLSSLASSSWPTVLWPSVITIANCESGLNPQVPPGDSGRAIGLMQIRRDVHYTKMEIYDAYTAEGSLEIAWLIFKESLRDTGDGFLPWSCKA